jgi:hypothetical protein
MVAAKLAGKGRSSMPRQGEQKGPKNSNQTGLQDLGTRFRTVLARHLLCFFQPV